MHVLPCICFLRLLSSQQRAWTWLRKVCLNCAGVCKSTVLLRAKQPQAWYIWLLKGCLKG